MMHAHGLDTVCGRLGLQAQSLKMHQGRQEMAAKSVIMGKLCIALNECIKGKEDRKSIISVSI